MKTTALKSWTVVGLSVLTATVGFRAFAEQTAADRKPDKTYTGTVTAVDPQNRLLTVKGMLFSRQFNLGASCQYRVLGKLAASAGDLRVGQKVKVDYQEAQGVRIADQIEQQPMRYTGTVRALDLEKHTLTLHTGGLNREFQVGDDCLVALRNNQPGRLAELKPGYRVTVTYELPNPGGARQARQIAWTSATFEGELTAIDLSDRTLKVRAALNSRKFNLARQCMITTNGQTDGRLPDLKLGDRLVLNYDDVSGVHIVNRIAVAASQPAEVTAQSSRP